MPEFHVAELNLRAALAPPPACGQCGDGALRSDPDTGEAGFRCARCGARWTVVLGRLTRVGAPPR